MLSARDEKRADELAADTLTSATPSRDQLVMWRAYLPYYLEQTINSQAGELVKKPYDEPLPDIGILSLVVRNHMAGRFFTSVTRWLALWNPWTWRTRTSGRLNYPYYLSELFLIALVLAVVRAILAFVMREAAAVASIEAATSPAPGRLPPHLPPGHAGLPGPGSQRGGQPSSPATSRPSTTRFTPG